MLKDPRGVLRDIHQDRTVLRRVERHAEPYLARCQDAFLAAAQRHNARASSLMLRARYDRATLHRGVAELLLAYAQPHEIERLPHVHRPGPEREHRVHGIHPAVIAFAEGCAEEFMRLCGTGVFAASAIHEHTAGDNLFAAFQRANFDRIYLARLTEFATLLREGRSSTLAEAMLMRRYGPQDI